MTWLTHTSVRLAALVARLTASVEMKTIVDIVEAQGQVRLCSAPDAVILGLHVVQELHPTSGAALFIMAPV